MKTLYLELNMGASGDMLMATLFELIDEKEKFLEKMNSLGFEDLKIEANRVIKSGISGTNMSVIVGGEEEESVDVDFSHSHHHHGHHHDHNHEHHHHSHGHNGEHHHNSLKDVIEIIENMDLSDEVKNNSIAIYKLIGEAESNAHNKPMEDVHFHEVGTIDAIYDIVGNCILIEMIKPDNIIASPVHVGSGNVKCAHGIMPVPAPATAFILKDVPIYGGRILGELCTPTGAAILKHYVKEFGEMPIMKVEKIGYGMGKKEFEAVNCVRGFLGTVEGSRDDIFEFVCTLDDMTGEEVGFLYDLLFLENALEVYVTNVHMKKNRPGIMLTVLSLEKDREKILETIFKHTTTIGIKEYKTKRHKLERTEEIIDSKYGKVRKKVSKGYGVVREKLEYEDLKEIAEKEKISLREIKSYFEKN